MNLDHVFSLITLATAVLFYKGFVTTLRRRLGRCMVVQNAHRPVRGASFRKRAERVA